jgi:diacylglycerol kinase family enzyme
MRYGIVVNPKAGGTSVDEKRELLEEVREILGGDCAIAGLDSESAEQFRSLVAETARRAEILIAAGGDGSVSDAINAVEENTILSFLPIGSACALRDALGLPDDPLEVARRIRAGREHRLDLILCDDRRKAFVCGVGVEGEVLKRREELQEDGKQGFTAYAAALASVFGEMDRIEMTVSLDGRRGQFANVATAVVTKIPYYGYKMQIVPEAVFDDGLLYLRVFDESWPQILAGLAKARVVGSETESVLRAQRIEIRTQKKRYLHIDGNVDREGDAFRFEVLPGALRMWY